MPGVPFNRFVDAIDLKEFTCFICRQVWCKPLATGCCRQVFCELCIKPYIEIKHTCPADRKPLAIEGLAQPPAPTLKMLGALKMKCTFTNNGCTEVCVTKIKFSIFNLTIFGFSV